MEEISKLYYNHYVNLFTDSKDLETLSELYLLKQKYPDFNFSKFKVGVFSAHNIEKFGQDFLINNYDLLTEELLTLDLEKINIVIKNQEINKFHVSTLKKLTIEQLKKIDSITNIDELILLKNLSCLDDFDEKFEILIDEREKLLFIGQNFEEVYSHSLSEKVKDFILDNDSSKLLFIVDKDYLKNDMKLNNFLTSYQECKQLIKYVDNTNVKEFNDILFNSKKIGLEINNIDDLYNYFDIKSKKVTKLIDNNIDNGKEIVSQVYFNISYKILKKSLETAKKCKLFDEYTILLDIKNPDELKKFISQIKNKTNIYLEIEKGLMPISKNSIICNISKTIPTNDVDNKVIKLDGEKFSFLIHSIKGYGNSKMADLLAENPSYWYKNPMNDSYISTSFINQDFLGMTDSKSYILGFNDIEIDDILYIGTEDIYSSSKQVRNNLRNSKNCCILAEDFSKNPDMIYNEVTLRRIKNGKILSPNFILALDNINNNDKEAANYFKVPIYLLNRMKYASIMQNKLNENIENDDLDNYYLNLKRMFLSFYNNFEIMDKYFNSNKIEIDILNIIKKYILTDDIEKLKKVEKIVVLYNNLIEMYNFNNEGSIDYDVNRYVAMLKINKN